MYTWANYLVVNCTSSATTLYTNTIANQIVTWKGEHGATAYRCTTDCSGLVNSLFTQQYGYTSSTFNTLWGSSRPKAITYYNAIIAQKKFIKKTYISQLQQGDYIAVKYTGGEDNTGHIMMVVSNPVKRATPTAPLVASSNQWEVTVIDCSNSGHGSTDKRNIAPTYSGVGKGILRLYTTTNASATIIGYTWSTYSNSVYYSVASRPIAVGQFVE